MYIIFIMQGYMYNMYNKACLIGYCNTSVGVVVVVAVVGAAAEAANAKFIEC